MLKNQLLKRLFFPPLNYLGIHVENQLAVSVRAYFWTLSFFLWLRHTVRGTSPSRDQTHAPCIGSRVLTTGPPRKSYFWTFNFSILIFSPTVFPGKHRPDYWKFLVSFEIKKWVLLLCSFYKTVLVIQGPLNFHMNFRIILSISAREEGRILTEIALNLRINLGSIAILTILSSGPTTWMLFHLLSFFQQCFKVFSIQTSFVLLFKNLF